jgi:hypothetical protein
VIRFEIMLRTTYGHLNTIQKGSFAEAYAKMAFTLKGFEVYTTEYDDRGVDFVIRNASGGYFSVQVKATMGSANPFVYKDKFSPSADFVFCAVRLINGNQPEIYLARGSEWLANKDYLACNASGGTSGAYYEMRFAAKYAQALQTHQFEQYVAQLR